MIFETYINDLEKRAAESIKAEQGDYYGDDGLLICGKCHTKKQTRVTFLGQEKTPMCLCKCAAEEREREAFIRRVAQNRQVCFEERKMQEWTFGNDDGANAELSEAMKKYAADFQEFKKKGKGILLYGDVGRGKTYLAACIANAVLDKGYTVLMTDFNKIESTVSEIWDKQGYYNALNKFSLLVLDDLSTERKTEYMSQIVQAVINTRYNAGLPTVITTNLTGEELQSPSDMVYKRIFSRLYEMCIPIKVEGKDRRAEILKADVSPMKKILGLL